MKRNYFTYHIDDAGKVRYYLGMDANNMEIKIPRDSKLVDRRALVYLNHALSKTLDTLGDFWSLTEGKEFTRAQLMEAASIHSREASAILDRSRKPWERLRLSNKQKSRVAVFFSLRLEKAPRIGR